MARYGIVPPEPPIERSLESLAPRMHEAVQALLKKLVGGLDEQIFETLRTDTRRSWLYGMGRIYDDGRGRVTNASIPGSSWHEYGLAVDVVEKDATPWKAPVSFWNEIGAACDQVGLVWGGRWHTPDLPHVQWGRCPQSPTSADRRLLVDQGMVAVWRKYGAIG